jgi:aspartate/methionine/tyrosine aminotransferase
MGLRFHAPYMEWAKSRPTAAFDLATSTVSACTIEDLPGARDAVALSGHNDNGYLPLLQAIAARYRVRPEQVTTATGAAGANFQACAALLEPGDDVLVERPGYDPLLGAPRLLGARVIRFDRSFEDRYSLDPGRVRSALTPRTRLIIVTSPHNPSGAMADRDALIEVGRIAEDADAYVLVDEVYLDTIGSRPAPAALLGDRFISTSSLTKSYGLASLRCGWSLSSARIAERIRRARDVIDGTGSIVAERLAALAFGELDRLAARAASILETNGSLVRDFLRVRPDLQAVEPAGGTVVFPGLRDANDSTDFCERLMADRGTAVVPGRFFEAPAHFRIGFGCTSAQLVGGLKAIGALLDDTQNR